MITTQDITPHINRAYHEGYEAARAEFETERAARDTVIRDSISDILGRALAGYTEEFKLMQNGQTYIRWGEVEDAIRALFDKEHPIADVMNENRYIQHQLTMARIKIERLEKRIELYQERKEKSE